MYNQNNAFDLEATKIRPWFAEELGKMRQIIAQSEKQATKQGASGELALSAFINNLDQEIEKLKNGKFRFLIIGDFNRGKSTILNAFFEQELLPMGAVATTAIPTFVKYGEEEKVLVHKKDGTKERLSFKQYKEQYTLNSGKVKEQIKNIFKSVGGWLNPLDYAEFYCPIEVLSRGVEFIDTAGLNHTEEENNKTFSYISQSQAILFVLAADQQFTIPEKDYLQRFLEVKKEIEKSDIQPEVRQNELQNKSYKNQVRPIFYLINKWENIDEESKEDVHGAFVDGFCKCLKINENEAEKMWGDTVFDVCAKTALESLRQGNSIDGTGIKEFQKRLNDFLIHERLMTELLQTVYTAKFVATGVGSKINERLFVLKDDLKTLEGKIEKTKPCIALMKKGVQILETNVRTQKDACIDKIGGEYHKYFSDLVINFERDFEMPPVSGLKDNEREQYTRTLEKKLTQYRQEKLENWHNISKGIVLGIINPLNDSFNKEIDDYTQQRDVIREILNPKNFNARNQTGLSIHANDSSEEVSLDKADANAIIKMLMGGTGGTVGTIAAGAGTVAIANMAGANLFLLTAGLALTPVGWALLGASAVVGGGLAWWQRRGEVQKFQKEMQEKVKKEFQKLLEPDKVSNLKKQVSQLFEPFQNLATLISEDVQSLEKSLNNVLESKRTTEVNCEAEEERLKILLNSISAQLEIINAKYEEIERKIK
ncbi:dynamin family protein [Anabaena sp. PCC 7108]|uniref:dynamin family protein n=1 Tax=Anabaena sp. PCC 7108 TaxID=163908 RepID=UPI00034BED08|nr:dynamin family protein [Anabaena sp. PCC 7108]